MRTQNSVLGCLFLLTSLPPISFRSWHVLAQLPNHAGVAIHLSDPMAANRSLHVQTLEKRELLAGDLELIAVSPNSGSFISDGTELTERPRELTFQFTPGQIIDPTTLDAIQIIGSGGDGTFGDGNEVAVSRGFVGLGDSPDQVIFRFGQSLVDDRYQISILGSGSNPLANTASPVSPFNDGVDLQREFDLDLGATVQAVIPQPVVRDASGAITQLRDTVHVYFNDDLLDAASAEDPKFYQLIDTSGSLDSGDDVITLPQQVTYDPATQLAVVKFANNLPDGTFRLQVGASEEPDSTLAGAFNVGTVLGGTPFSTVALVGDDNGLADVDLYKFSLPATAFAEVTTDLNVHAIAESGFGSVAAVATDFNTAGAVNVQFSAQEQGASGNDLNVLFTTSDRTAAGESPVGVSITEGATSTTIEFNLDTDTGNGFATPATALQLIGALNGHPTANQLLTATATSGDVTSAIGATTTNNTSLTLTGGVSVQLDAIASGLSGNDINLEVTQTDRTLAGLVPVGVAVVGPNIIVDLDTDASNGGAAASTIQQVVDALNGDIDIAALISASVSGGSPATVVGNNSIGFSPIILGGAVDVRFSAVPSGAAGNLISVVFTQSNRPSTSPSVGFSVVGNVLTIDMDSDSANGGIGASTARELVDLLNADPVASALVGVSLVGGSDSTLVGDTSINFSPLALQTMPTSIDIRVIPEAGSLDSVIRLFDSSGSVIATADVAGNGATDSLTHSFSPNGGEVFYLGVSSSGNNAYLTDGTGAVSGTSTGSYQLSINTLSPSESGGDADDNSSFATATDLGSLGAGGQVIDAAIEAQRISLPGYPGGPDEPGHRHIQPENHGALNLSNALPDGISVVKYSFPVSYGTNQQGITLFNEITENQKDRAREIYEIFASLYGFTVQEVASGGTRIITGDIRVSQPAFPLTVSVGGGGSVILTGAADWGTSPFGGSWMGTALHEIGHSIGLFHSYDIPSVQGAPGVAEDQFPGNNDIVHGRSRHRPDATDIDMYRFEVAEAGTITAEIVAERRDTSSLLDSALKLYRLESDGTRTLIAQNDDYFGDDAFISLPVDQAGTYFLGVTSKGNTDYDPSIPDSGHGGLSDGLYELKLNFSRAAISSIVDATGNRLDGDADGIAGGTFEFDFRSGNTLLVDKASSAAGPGNGSATTPFKNIDDAIAIASGGDVIRIVANGGADNDLSTLEDNEPYLVGLSDSFAALEDGSKLDVPKNVLLQIDPGTIIKLQKTNINVGSIAQGVDRSGGAIQVLGTPDHQVILTAYGNDAIGGDSDGVTDGANSGDWGGIVFRHDSDFIAADASTNADDFPITLNYVNLANISFGGGLVSVNGSESAYTPIHVIESRPTISYNAIRNSAGGAISADPDSFSDSNGRMGPDIVGNLLTANSINGLVVRDDSATGANGQLNVSARFDDTDIVHVLTSNLVIAGNPGGQINPANPNQILQGGRLAIDPGVVVKLSSSRIEGNRGSANLIAEGTPENPVIFTSLLDDRFGGGGTFDTSGNGQTSLPSPGDWSGLVFNATSRASIDNALISYAGGESPIAGGLSRFNTIEVLHGARVRVANSTFNFNANGNASDNRDSRGSNTAATIFVRQAQPIIVNNVFTDNEGSIIDINANAMLAVINRDTGRSTGPLDVGVRDGRDPLNPAFDFADNRGPLVRANRLENNSINGMTVRGGQLSTESIWDDTDIVHVLRSEIIVDQHHTSSGLQLRSSSDESLVVKLSGANAGFTADGVRLDIDDRIGGTVEILGRPGFPVVLTSLADDTAYASLDPAGFPQTDTNNDGVGTVLGGGGTGPVDNGPLGPIQITSVSTDANALRDILLGPGITPLGDATLIGGTNSSGFFDVGFESIGMKDGIILTTGNVDQAVVGGVGSGNASGTGDADLDALFNVTTTDTTSLEFDFSSDGGDLFFNFVFASNEYNSFVNSNFNDAFALFLDGVNIALVPNTTDPISINNVNNGNPLGTGATNPQFYNNNEGATAVAPTTLGYDGFTDVFTASFENLAAGSHTIKMTVSDVSDSALDSAIFIQAGTFSDEVVAGGSSGDWRSLRFNQYANDRNVRTVLEDESANNRGIETNDNAGSAQNLGELAKDLKNGDDNRALGFEVNGFISADDPGDIDVYSFNVDAGTEVWIDIDRSRGAALDARIELVRQDGTVLAASTGADDAGDLTGLALPLEKHAYDGGDFYTTNYQDPGFRVILPGNVGGTNETYYVRVTSVGGLSSGEYELQVRLRQVDEKPGSIVQYADIRYATNGIEVNGLPFHSPLVGETGEDGTNNDSIAGAQELGNLLESDRNVISVGGVLSSANDVDNFHLNVDYATTATYGPSIQAIAGVNGGPKTWSTVFDVDYADGLTRADSTLIVYQFDPLNPTEVIPVLIGRESNIADDQPGFGQGIDLDDLARGSAGQLDPFIGPVHLNAGIPGDITDYYTTITSNARLLEQLNQTYRTAADNPLIRLEPVDSVTRVIEDHIGFQGYNTGPTPGTGQVLPRQTEGLFDITDQVSLSTTIRAFDLSDVPLFVSSQNRLETVNPLFGSITTDFGPLSANSNNFHTEDIVMRSDGTLWGYQRINGYAGNNLPDNGTAGRLVQLDPATGNVTVIGNDNVLGQTPTTDVTNSNGNNPGFAEITFTDNVDALAWERSGQVGFAAQYALYYSVNEDSSPDGGVTTIHNSKLYRANPVTGSATKDANAQRQYGERGDLQPADVSFAGNDIVVSDGNGANAEIRVQARAPGAAGNGFSVVVNRADLTGSLAPVFVNVLGGNTIVITADDTPNATAQQITDAINRHPIARQLVTAGVINGNPGEAGSAGITGFLPVTNGSDGIFGPGFGPLLGNVTGLSFGQFHGDASLASNSATLYGVTDAGEFVTINTGSGAVTNVVDLSSLLPAGDGFEGLALGPQNLLGGSLSTTLFAVTAGGQLVALNPASFNPVATVRADNDPATFGVAAFDSTGDGAPDAFINPAGTALSPTGLAFSPLDFNLWHPTTRRAGTDTTGDGLVDTDAGHGINPTFNLSRFPSTEDASITDDQGNAYGLSQVQGGASLYFGLEQYVDSDTQPYLNYEAPRTQSGILFNDFHRDLTSGTIGNRLVGGVADSGDYDLPGGALGSIVTNPFDLTSTTTDGAESGDRPTVYFNYFLDTEDQNTSAPDGTARDTARVFISRDGGNNWALIATNNTPFANNGGQGPTMSTTEVPDFISHLATASPVATLVQPLFDSSGSWRQSRIDLSGYAGESDLRLRFDFSSAGTILDLATPAGEDTGLSPAVSNPSNDPDLVSPVDNFGNLNDIRRGQNNDFEGFYIDDIIIGWSERGEIITGANNNTDFFSVPQDPDPAAPTLSLQGPYQLEIRRGHEFASVPDPINPGIFLGSQFDPNVQFIPGADLQLGSSEDDFESGDFELIGWDPAAGDSAWTVTNITGTSLEAVSGGLELAQRSDLEVTVTTGAGLLTFDQFFTPDPSGSDRFQVFIDGESEGGPIYETTSGNSGLTSVSISVTAGVHTFTFSYQKDASGTANTGSVVIDNVVFPNPSGGQIIGDRNIVREQGHFHIQGNIIRDILEDAIHIEAGTRGGVPNPLHIATNFPNPGSPIQFETLNTAGFVPGVTVSNNLITRFGSDGISLGGDPITTDVPQAALPLGKFVNNTIYGGISPNPNGNKAGIRVENNASPTLLNNLIVNTAIGVDVDGTSSGTVLARTYFRGNSVNTAGVTSTLEIADNPANQLFVNVLTNNFYLAGDSDPTDGIFDGALPIDRSLSKIDDRTDFVAVKSDLGIAASNVLSPRLDVFGQIRVDDANQPPSGVGSEVFNDVGAIERGDFIGPFATLATPLDNSLIDQNPTNHDVVKLETNFLTQLVLQLNDSGIGIDDSLVDASQWEVKRNDQVLTEGADYTFIYNPASDRVVFQAVTVFPTDSRYTITLIDRTPETGIHDIANNPIQANRSNGDVRFEVVLQNGVNDPPLNVTPSAQTTTEDVALVFNDANANLITVSDPDAFLGTNQMTITLTPTHGMLAPIAVTGVTQTNAGSVIALTGEIDKLNEALNGMSFLPDADYFGPASIVIHTNDNGEFSGLPLNPQSDIDTIAITVTAVNDAPLIDPIVDQTIAEDTTTLTVTLTGVAPGPANETEEVRIVSATSSNPNIIPDGTSPTSSPGSIVFSPVPDAFGTATITVTVEDAGADGDINTPADNLTTVVTFDIIVTPVNDSPTIDAISNLVINEDEGPGTVSLTGIAGGPFGETEPVRLSVSTNNSAIITNPQIVYTSPDTTGTLSYDLVPNQFGGPTTVSVSVEDAGPDGIFDDDLATVGVDESADNLSFTRSFDVTVDPVNDLPTIDALADQNVMEDSGPHNVNLSGITTGAINESEPIRVTATSSDPAIIPNPTISYTDPSSTGTLTYQPTADAFGSVIITVQVEDAGLDGNLNTPSDNGIRFETFNVLVTPVNDAPGITAVPDQSIDEDSGPGTVNLSGIGPGAANESEAVTTSVSVTGGDASIIENLAVNYTSPDSTGTVTYDLVADAFGTVEVSIELTDAGLDGIAGNADDATTTEVFQVIINPVNDAPLLNALANQVIFEDLGPGTINLFGIDNGPANESEPVRITAASSDPSIIDSFTVNYTSLDATGTIDYTLVADAFGGPVVVTVSVEDAGLDGVFDDDLATPLVDESADNATIQQTLTVTVAAVNDDPTLDANDVVVDEDSLQTTVSLTGIFAGGGESQPLNITATSDNLSLIPNPTVTYSSADTTGSLAFTPVADAFGSATITVSIEDGGLDTNLSTTADNNTFLRTFVVTVNPINDAPTLASVSDQIVDEDSASQSLNLTGVSAGPNETGSVSITATSDNSSLIPDPSVTYDGTSGTALLSYQPVADQFGSANITVTITDGGTDGDLSTLADNLTLDQVFVVTVNPINDVPTISPISTQGVDEDSQEVGIPFAGVTAGGGETQSVRITATSSDPGLVPDPTVVYADPDSTGELRIQPVGDQFGSAVITVTVEDAGLDGDFATTADNLITTESFVINVAPVNDPPTLSSLADQSVDEDSGIHLVNLSGITAGVNENDPISVSVAFSNPSLIESSAVNYTSPLSTGTFSYTPAENQFGTTTVTVTVEDGGLDNDLSTTADNATFEQLFLLTINPVNDNPLVDPISDQSFDEDSNGVAVNVTGIAAGPGETGALRVTSTSSNPGLIPAPNVTYTSPSATAQLDLSPVADGFGTATITVQIEDAGEDNDFATTNDNLTVTESFTVTVNNLPDSPVANDDTGQTDEDSFLVINATKLLANDTDVDQGNNSGEVLSVNSVEGTSQLGATITFDPSTGDLTYDPTTSAQLQALAQGSALQDSFVYSITDADGEANPPTATVFLNVNGVNDAPIVVDDLIPASQTGQLTDPIIIKPTLNDFDIDGTLVLASLIITAEPLHGSLAKRVIAGELELEYTPFADFTGSDSFNYTIADDLGQASAHATVTLQPDQRPRTGSDVGGGVASDGINIDVLANDEPVAGSLDVSSLTIVTPPANGTATIQPDGTISYAPNTGFIGQDSFRYTIADTNGNVSEPVTVEVNSVASGLQNPFEFTDVNANGEVTALDALLVINRIARANGGDVIVDPNDRGPNYFDVNGSMDVTALDALLVINRIARGSDVIEGEWVADELQSTPLADPVAIAHSDAAESQDVLGIVSEPERELSAWDTESPTQTDATWIDLIAEATEEGDESIKSLTDAALQDLF